MCCPCFWLDMYLKTGISLMTHSISRAQSLVPADSVHANVTLCRPANTGLLLSSGWALPSALPPPPWRLLVYSAAIWVPLLTSNVPGLLTVLGLMLGVIGDLHSLDRWRIWKYFRMLTTMMVLPVFITYLAIKKSSLFPQNSLSNTVSLLMGIYYIHLLSYLLDYEVHGAVTISGLFLCPIPFSTVPILCIC